MSLLEVTSYRDIVESFGWDVIAEEEMGDYQGDLFILATRAFDKSGRNYALFVTGYGSCTGCDALEDFLWEKDPFKSQEKITELANDMMGNAQMGTYEYLHNAIRKRDPALDWYRNDPKWTDLKAKLITALEEYEKKSVQPITVTADASVVDGRGEGDIPRFDWMGFDRRQREQAKPRVDDKGATAKGMSANDLWCHQRVWTEDAARRLLTVGAEQYDLGQRQKFEDMPLKELFAGFDEELMDIVNYATMLAIRLERIWNALPKDVKQ